ncbi:MAG: prolyl oligopeptidase family serine peptidase [Gemmatimonadetes bacterium]|nr:prolyl oligopeptidase family serine peptidase [Gemmatimonadota bacterium]
MNTMTCQRLVPSRTRVVPVPTLVMAALLAAALVVAAAPRPLSAQKAALDHDAYDRWARVHSQVLAPGGRHAAYVVEPHATAGRLVVHALDGDARLTLPRAHSPRFSANGRHFWATVAAHRDRNPWTRTLTDPDPAEEGRDREGRSGAPQRARPGRDVAGTPDTLVVVDLLRAFASPSEGVTRIPGGASARSPDRNARWLAYLAPGGADDAADDGVERTLVVLDLESGGRETIPRVEQFHFSADGARLWYVTGGPRSALWSTRPGAGRGTRALAPGGRIRHVALDGGGERAAVLVREGERDAHVDRWTLWRVDAVGGTRPLAGPDGAGLPEGRVLSEGLGVRFSPDGGRVFVGTVAHPADAEAPDPDADRVRVDVWSWTDAHLQPEQILRTREERERAFLAVVPWAGGPVVQLEDEALPDVTVAAGGDGDIGLGISDVPYRRLASWDGRYVDVYRVDVRTGRRSRVLEGLRDRATLSPTGRWATWWDGEARAWRALEMETGRPLALSEGIPTALHDELDDRPQPPGPYGMAGWTAGDARAVLYDRYDVWAVDPEGTEPPRNLTEGVGRRERIRLRHQDLEGGGPVPWRRDVLLSAFDEETRRAGFYRDRFASAAEPIRLVLSDHHWGEPSGAARTDRLVLTRESFTDSPDVWVASDAFSDVRRLSDGNPQQREYRWGSAELVSWTSRGGASLQGILYKPDGFDPERRHPLLVTFYERSSDELHHYQAPAAGGASINRSLYVSRGYLVFVPDIPYEVGHPGRSALEAVVPGVEALVARGFVDPERIGLQGHSWGGYQVAYLVTRTDLFAAAQAGAPVVNMTSAYGAIRRGSGVSRMFQYEEGQSRIGTTLWEGLDLYLENSPIFAADEVATPLLMLHNDRDTAVPWEQGIEMFVALRRLGKPAWLLNYNGEEHGLRREANRRDWAVRMQQFFDHYLMGEAPPVWMVEGVPASRKGTTLGLDLVDDGTVPTDSMGRRPPGG